MASESVFNPKNSAVNPITVVQHADPSTLLQARCFHDLPVELNRHQNSLRSFRPGVNQELLEFM